MTTMYGLPSDVRFCKTCVISNQRPSSCIEYQHTAQSVKQTIQFDAEGICSACRVAERKRTIDWQDRERQLRELCDQHRKHNGSYDCLVPGSGGKDSFYQALTLKRDYGMHPLTVTWRPGLYTDVGWRNHTAWIDAGLDNILFSPNGQLHRYLVTEATRNLLHPFQPFILGQKNLAPKMAKLYGIELVFYGENESEYGNPVADMTSAHRSYKYFTSHHGDEIFLAGLPLDQLRQRFNDNELSIYLPSDPDQMLAAGIDVRYLGYYLPWHPQSMFYFASDNGFQCNPDGRTDGTFSKYSGIDDKVDWFHFYCTYIKFGIGRATYDASQEIRSGDITREEGVALVKQFDGEWPKTYAADFLEYVGMSEAEFLRLCNRFKSPHLWEGVEIWEDMEDDLPGTLRHQVWDDCDRGADGVWRAQA